MSDTENQLTSSVEGLRDLAEAIANGDQKAKLEWFGGDMEGDLEEIDSIISESVLAVDTEIVKSVVFGTGGPHVEIEVTLSKDLEPLRARVVGFWSGDELVRHLSTDTAEALAEYFMLSA